MTESKAHVHVAVAVIIDEARRILIALRQSHQHQGDLWEFPGGKVEATETVEQALKREIQEEVNITIRQAVPMTTIQHDYGDKVVVLDVWQVTDFSGQAQGMEGQRVTWCAIEALSEKSFPAANTAIIEAINQMTNRETANA